MSRQAETNDYSKWTPNIKVRVWGNPAKGEKPDNCPIPEIKRCVGDYDDCPYFMGWKTDKNECYWGDTLSACCGKLLVGDSDAKD